jgi:hypothetical protein
MVELFLSGSINSVVYDGIVPVLAWGTGAKFDQAGFPGALSAVLGKV